MLLLLEMRNARVLKRFPPIKFAFSNLGLYYITAFHYVLHARGKFQMGNNRIGSLRFYAHVKAFEIGILFFRLVFCSRPQNVFGERPFEIKESFSLLPTASSCG